MSPTSNDSKAGTLPPLWLEVTADRGPQVFRLDAEDDRAVLVGTVRHADVRVTAPGIAPVHFHFERDRETVWLVSDVASDLRLDGAPVLGPCTLAGRSRIDLCGVRFDVRVLADAPSHADATRPSTHAVGLDYLAALPSEAAETVSFAPFSATTRIAVSVAAPERLPSGALGPYGTERIPVQRAPIAAPRSAPLVPGPVPITPRALVSLTKTVTVARPLALPPASQAAGPGALPSPKPSLPTVSTQETTAFEMSAIVLDGPGRQGTPEEGSALAGSGATVRSSFAVRVGALAKRRPVLVGVATLVTGLSLALALVAARRSLVGAAPRSLATSARSLAVPPASEARAPSVSSATLASFPAPPPATAGETRGQHPGDPDVAAAARHLVAGRTAAAAQAYAALAGRSEKDPAVVTLARLLAKATGPRCEKTSEALPSCPEVKR